MPFEYEAIYNSYWKASMFIQSIGLHIFYIIAIGSNSFGFT
jgi:hypothetical protein